VHTEEPTVAKVPGAHRVGALVVQPHREPAGQARQTDALQPAYVPGGQPEQLLWFAFEEKPAGHSSGLMVPGPLQNVPGGHSMQEIWPSASEKDPGGHTLQVEQFTVQNVPGAHGNIPRPGLQYLPGGQTEHALAFPSENSPALQAVQADAPASENKPAWHGSGLLCVPSRSLGQ